MCLRASMRSSTGVKRRSISGNMNTDSKAAYSNHQNFWQKLGGTKGAWPRCRPWRASARLRPPPCPAPFVLPSFFVMNSEACYRPSNISSEKFRPGGKCLRAGCRDWELPQPLQIPAASLFRLPESYPLIRACRCGFDVWALRLFYRSIPQAVANSAMRRSRAAAL